MVALERLRREGVAGLDSIAGGRIQCVLPVVQKLSSKKCRRGCIILDAPRIDAPSSVRLPACRKHRVVRSKRPLHGMTNGAPNSVEVFYTRSWRYALILKHHHPPLISRVAQVPETRHFFLYQSTPRPPERSLAPSSGGQATFGEGHQKT